MVLLTSSMPADLKQSDGYELEVRTEHPSRSSPAEKTNWQSPQ